MPNPVDQWDRDFDFWTKILYNLIGETRTNLKKGQAMRKVNQCNISGLWAAISITAVLAIVFTSVIFAMVINTREISLARYSAAQQEIEGLRALIRGQQEDISFLAGTASFNTNRHVSVYNYLTKQKTEDVKAKLDFISTYGKPAENASK